MTQQEFKEQKELAKQAVALLEKGNRKSFLQYCRRNNIKGKPSNPGFCLVANYLRHRNPKFNFKLDCYQVRTFSYLDLNVHIPKWVTKLIVEFDLPQYNKVHLLERYRDRS